MFHLKFFHRPAGISPSRPEFGHEASSSVQSQSAPDQVGPELGLGLVPPVSGPAITAAHFLRSLPSRRVGTHVLHVPWVQSFTFWHQVAHGAGNATRVPLHPQLAEAGAAHQLGVSIRDESCKGWSVTLTTFFVLQIIVEACGRRWNVGFKSTQFYSRLNSPAIIISKNGFFFLKKAPAQGRVGFWWRPTAKEKKKKMPKTGRTEPSPQQTSQNCSGPSTQPWGAFGITVKTVTVVTL